MLVKTLDDWQVYLEGKKRGQKLSELGPVYALAKRVLEVEVVKVTLQEPMQRSRASTRD